MFASGTRVERKITRCTNDKQQDTYQEIQGQEAWTDL